MHSGTYIVKVGHYANRTGYVEEPEEFQVHYNGDYSGDIKVQLDTRQLIERLEAQDGVCFINLPYDLFEQIVMDKLKLDLETKVEQMDKETFKKFLREVF